MTLVPARELRNNTAAVIERARNGEDVTITVNGVAAVRLVPIATHTREFLTTSELLRMRPAKPVAEPHPHDRWHDDTDELGPIE